MVGKSDICEGVTSIFILDTDLEMFDGLMPLPNGTSYNAYLIEGSEKNALIDTSESRKVSEFMFEISELGYPKIDYIISNHAEQDHSGAIPALLEKYPDAKVVTNAKGKKLLMSELPAIPEDKFILVEHEEELSLGNKTLKFLMAPWVHWPETMFTYLKEDKILFPCDFFGAHIAQKETFVKDLSSVLKPAKRYYAEILMPYENFVKKHLKMLENYEIDFIAPSHGPVHKDPKPIIDLYKKWSSDKIIPKVVVAYATMHQSTEEMALEFTKKLGDKKIPAVCYNILQSEIGTIVTDMMGAFAFVLCSPTYLGGMHPAAANLMYNLKGFRPNIMYHAFIGSFGWGGGANKEYDFFAQTFRSEKIGEVTTEGFPTKSTYSQIDVLLDELETKHKELLKNPDQIDTDSDLDEKQKRVLLEAHQKILDEAIRRDPNAPADIKFDNISNNDEGADLGLGDSPEDSSDSDEKKESKVKDDSESDEIKTASVNTASNYTATAAKNPDDESDSEPNTKTDSEKDSTEKNEKESDKSDDDKTESDKNEDDDSEPKEIKEADKKTESETKNEEIKETDETKTAAINEESQSSDDINNSNMNPTTNINLDDIKTKLEKKLEFKDDVSLVICGEAGQGLQTIQQVLTHLLINDGFNIYTTKEYMSRVRGGTNSVEIRVSSNNRKGFVNEIDILIPLDNKAIPHLEKRITDKTLIIGNEEIINSDHEMVNIPFVKLAQQIGNRIYANTITISFFFSLFNGDIDKVKSFIEKRFEKKGETIISENIKAAEIGFELGKRVREDTVTISINKNEKVSDDIYLCGTDAVGIGAIAGGCNFISNYPMSPSTGVLVFLAGQQNNFDIVVEQAEDEISAINMGLGASYAGARSMITTSGGGLALMSEAVSLCGIIETPMVLHIAQRPGPATGLPTRTGQEDLNLALHSGHGEFPRMIFAPGTLEDGFYLTQRAFNMAEKYQIPVFILTDQYYVDTYYNTQPFEIEDLDVVKTFIKTDEGYLRYEYRSDGVSPRGIPGFGEGLVPADSDEHEENGHITESMSTRIRMNDKRLKKQETMMPDVLPPTRIGKEDYDIAVICWGSTFPTIREAIEDIGYSKIALFHFSQVYPLYPDTSHIIKHAQKTIIFEMNATAQFAKIIRAETGLDITEKVLKYDGIMFTKEEVKTEILKRI